MDILVMIAWRVDTLQLYKIYHFPKWYGQTPPVGPCCRNTTTVGKIADFSVLSEQIRDGKEPVEDLNKFIFDTFAALFGNCTRFKDCS